MLFAGANGPAKRVGGVAEDQSLCGRVHIAFPAHRLSGQLRMKSDHSRVGNIERVSLHANHQSRIYEGDTGGRERVTIVFEDCHASISKVFKHIDSGFISINRVCAIGGHEGPVEQD